MPQPRCVCAQQTKRADAHGNGNKSRAQMPLLTEHSVLSAAPRINYSSWGSCKPEYHYFLTGQILPLLPTLRNSCVARIYSGIGTIDWKRLMNLIEYRGKAKTAIELTSNLI
jgi:hypothetical protein